jgi:hypothetical protein
LYWDKPLIGVQFSGRAQEVFENLGNKAKVKKENPYLPIFSEKFRKSTNSQ